MSEFRVELDPSTKAHIVMKLFRKTQNVPDLRKKVMNGQLKCCIIKPNLIIHPFQVVIAANKALIAEEQKRLITRSVFSEILFNLSASKNVRKSLPLFGIGDKHSDILVVTFNKNNVDNSNIFNVVKGQETDMQQLERITDLRLIKKVYNISSEEEANSDLLEIIVNKMVTKDF